MRTPFASDNWEFINGKWVELNPKTKKPFTREERKEQSKLNQGRYPGSLDPKIKGEFASKGNLPEWAFKNVSRPVGDALTDAVNMLRPGSELSSEGKYQSKFQQEGPAKTQRSWLENEIAQSMLVPQEDRLDAKQSKIALANYNKTPRDTLNQDLEEVSVKTGQESKPVDKSGYSWVDRVQEKLGYDRSGGIKNQEVPEKKSLIDPEKAAKDKWLDATRNSPAARSKAFTGQERWDLHKKHKGLRWDKKYTGVDEAVKAAKQTGSVADIANMDWSKSFGSITGNKLAGQLAASGLQSIWDFGKGKAGKSGWDAASAFKDWKGGSTALGISNPLSLGLKIIGKMISNASDKPGKKNLSPTKVAMEDPWEIWASGSQVMAKRSQPAWLLKIPKPEREAAYLVNTAIQDMLKEAEKLRKIRPSDSRIRKILRAASSLVTTKPEFYADLLENLESKNGLVTARAIRNFNEQLLNDVRAMPLDTPHHWSPVRLFGGILLRQSPDVARDAIKQLSDWGYEIGEDQLKLSGSRSPLSHIGYPVPKVKQLMGSDYSKIMSKGVLTSRSAHPWGTNFSAPEIENIKFATGQELAKPMGVISKYAKQADALSEMVDQTRYTTELLTELFPDNPELRELVKNPRMLDAATAEEVKQVRKGLQGATPKQVKQAMLNLEYTPAVKKAFSKLPSKQSLQRLIRSSLPEGYLGAGVVPGLLLGGEQGKAAGLLAKTGDVKHAKELGTAVGKDALWSIALGSLAKAGLKGKAAAVAGTALGAPAVAGALTVAGAGYTANEFTKAYTGKGIPQHVADNTQIDEILQASWEAVYSYSKPWLTGAPEKPLTSTPISLSKVDEEEDKYNRL